MTKTARCNWPARWGLRYTTKTLLVMKLTTVLLTAVLFNANATGISQTVRFSGKAVPLENVFSVVERQTGIVFMYFETALKQVKPVSIRADNVPVEEFIRE